MTSEQELAGATPSQRGRQWDTGLAALMARPGFICLLLAALTLAVFWPLKNCDYLYLDDPTYTTSNPHVRQGLTLNGVAWAFATRQASNWHPLAWLSHMLDVTLFGLGPAGPHVVNLLIHAANAVLLFLAWRGLTGAHWRSAFVAALFALHPLHVESVAWVAERKDVLSTGFWLLTLLAYGRYVDESKVQSPKSKVDYGLALLCFALGLMTKPMLVTLPFVLLLLDYWPLGRFPGFRSPDPTGETAARKLSTLNPQLSTALRLLWEKIPFFLLSGISCVVTFSAQNRAVGSLTQFPISARLGNAMVSYARYMGKMFWPTELALPYPHPGQWPFLTTAFATLFVAGLCFGALWLGRKVPFVTTGWFWFFGTLIPVIGLVQVGTQSMADRYTYVPLIGMFILLVWGADAAFKRWGVPGIVVRIASALVLAACALRTADQLRYWRNSETLFRHTLAVTRDNPLACSNLGYYLYNHGRWAEAVEHYHQALRMNPLDYATYDNLGFCYYNQGRLEEAITNYQQALSINPIDANALNNLGMAFTRQKRLAEAISCYEAALRARPDYPDAHNNLGVVLDELGRTAEAIPHYRRALRLAPDDVQAYNNLANALLSQGKVNEAITDYRRALRLDPNFTQALNNLGWALAGQSQYGEAITCYLRALKLRPDDELLHKNLGDILARTGRNNEAIREYAEAVRLAPQDAEAHFGLGRSLAGCGRRDEAVAELREVLRLKPDLADAKRELRALQVPAPE